MTVGTERRRPKSPVGGLFTNGRVVVYGRVVCEPKRQPLKFVVCAIIITKSWHGPERNDNVLLAQDINPFDTKGDASSPI